MRIRTSICLLSFTMVSCTAITHPPTPESARVEVSLEVSKTDAYERTVAAFVDEDLTVATGSPEGGFVVSTPDEISVVGVVMLITYRATIVAEGTTSRVILSGTLRNTQAAAFATVAGTADPGEQPLHSEMKGRFGEAWQRLERIAARLSR